MKRKKICVDQHCSERTKEYLRLAEAYGFIPFLRSPSTSNDAASSEQVLLEICDGLGLTNDDWIFFGTGYLPTAYFQSACQLMNQTTAL